MRGGVVGRGGRGGAVCGAGVDEVRGCGEGGGGGLGVVRRGVLWAGVVIRVSLGRRGVLLRRAAVARGSGGVDGGPSVIGGGRGGLGLDVRRGARAVGGGEGGDAVGGVVSGLVGGRGRSR